MAIRVFAALAALCCCMGQTFAIETRTGIAGQPRPTASVDELGWLAGSWSGEGISGPAHEVYSLPAGGAMAGHFVQQNAAGIWFYELITVRADGKSIIYCLRHFNADLTAWEEKNEVRCFPLIARELDTWYFDGLTIQREGDDGMNAAVRVQGESGIQEYVFRYQRSAQGQASR
jgi:Domain of unknown function (DUF6265)